MINAFISRLENLGFKTIILDDGSIKIYLECCSSWLIVLSQMDDERFFPCFYLRQRRVEEVTDLHDILPAVLTTISKCQGNGTFRFLGQHNEFSGIEDELYGMYWFPAQPLGERLRINSQEDIERLFSILFDLYMFHVYQGDLLGVDCDKEDDFSFDSPELQEWVHCIVQCLNEDASYVANLRKNPDWFYLRSFSSEFSICKSKHLAQLLKNFVGEDEQDIKKLVGVEAYIEICNDIRNTISYKDIAFANSILKSVDDHSQFKVVPQENLLVFISDEHILLKYSNCGLESIALEKELIRSRQQKEIELLFGAQKFIWDIADRNDSAEFEDLVLELLNREPWVFSVKKIAPTNQGDNGRDLICEYNMLHNEYQISKDDSSLKIGKMIVQCKTNLTLSKKSSVGKSDVDIANTIFDYRPDGYMLVVNTQITRDLTEMLERQKERGEQNEILWWNSFDVEDRLRKHPDILARYNNLVSYA